MTFEFLWDTAISLPLHWTVEASAWRPNGKLIFSQSFDILALKYFYENNCQNNKTILCFDQLSKTAFFITKVSIY